MSIFHQFGCVEGGEILKNRFIAIAVKALFHSLQNIMDNIIKLQNEGLLSSSNIDT